MRLLILTSLVAMLAFAAEVKLGEPMTLKQQTAIADLTARPADFVDKQVQVKGRVTEVCQNMGCWMQLVDPATKSAVRIKVKDGVIVFPKESVGKMAAAEGKFVKLELTHEQAIARAKHEAEEQNRPFNPDSVKGPATIYQIAGLGAVILE
jgi:hypothetical protein